MKKIYLITLLSLPAFANTLNQFEVTGYGFIRSSAIFSSEALASFNNINSSAPTHAVAQTRSEDKNSRLTFQTQQSRVGFNLKKGDNLSGKMEFDFIDFAKSSPTTQMVPRVRIASVTYQKDHHKFILGQDWDLYAPTMPSTFNYVGAYFMSGNTGFMRQQFQYHHVKTEWEYGAALGMAGNNPGTTDSDLEYGKHPTYSARVIRKFADGGKLGLSGIYTRLKFQATGENGTSHDSYAMNTFLEKTCGKFLFKGEAYVAQNLNNIGALAIGKGTQTTDVKEFGGYLTVQYNVNDAHDWWIGAGTARVSNKQEITPFSLNATNTISNPGIKNNFVSRMGYEWKITPDFSWITEFSRYETNSKITSQKYRTVVAESLDSGIQLRF
jgi:hypothetical protein